MSSIYLRQGGRLLAMHEHEYEAEPVLQKLLADHSELLTEDGRGLLLVRREAPLADRSEQTNAGWLDHLFLDRDGIPTLVEVKRKSDARLRREVVGQMLDYAANAVACWPDDTLRQWFQATCAPADPTEALLTTFPEIGDVEEYWARVRTNLSAGRLRLVFVADAIPLTLRRIVEFLDDQMNQAEVIAIEVKQYVDDRGEVQTLVPRVLGQTATRDKRPRSEPWDRDRILRALRERHAPEQVAVAEAIFAWAQRSGLREWFGSGSKDGSYQASVQLRDGRYLAPFALYTYGRIEVHFQYMARRPPFDDRDLREELRQRLNAIPGVDLTADQLELRPSFPLETLAAEASREQFLTAMDWAFDRFRSSAEQ